MKFEEVKEIQQKCQKALQSWGYRQGYVHIRFVDMKYLSECFNA